MIKYLAIHNGSLAGADNPIPVYSTDRPFAGTKGVLGFENSCDLREWIRRDPYSRSDSDTWDIFSVTTLDVVANIDVTLERAE